MKLYILLEYHLGPIKYDVKRCPKSSSKVDLKSESTVQLRKEIMSPDATHCSLPAGHYVSFSCQYVLKEPGLLVRGKTGHYCVFCKWAILALGRQRKGTTERATAIV